MSGFEELLAACQQLDAALAEHGRGTDQCAAKVAGRDPASSVKQLRMLLAKQHIVNAHIKQANRVDDKECSGHSAALEKLENATEAACMEQASKRFLHMSETLKQVSQMKENTLEEDCFKKQAAELFAELHGLELHLKHTMNLEQQSAKDLDAVRKRWADLCRLAKEKKAESRSRVSDTEEECVDLNERRRFEERLKKLETMRRLTVCLVLQSQKFKKYNWERDHLNLFELIRSYRRPITKESFNS